MNKILITGINGFVAQHFLDYLEANSIHSEVLGLDISNPESIKPYKFVRLQINKVDLLERVDVEEVVNRFRPDFVLHLASYSSVAYSWQNPVQSFRNNTNIFLNLVEAFRKYNIKTRILSVGSSEEYGNINIDHLPLVETSTLDPISPYAVARVSQEMLSKLYSDSYGVDIVMTRSFNHIGPGQRDAFVVSSFVKRAVDQSLSNPENRIHLRTGDLSIVRDFLDVRDVVKAYWLLLKEGQSGEVYNICSGEGCSLRQLIDHISEELGMPIDVSIDPELIRPNDNRIIIGDNRKLSSLGWNPLFSMQTSIQDIIQYWRSYYYEM